MQDRRSTPSASDRDAALPPPAHAPSATRSARRQHAGAAAAPLRADDDAPADDPGAIEYASWLRLLRRPLA